MKPFLGLSSIWSLSLLPPQRPKSLPAVPHVSWILRNSARLSSCSASISELSGSRYTSECRTYKRKPLARIQCHVFYSMSHSFSESREKLNASSSRLGANQASLQHLSTGSNCAKDRAAIPYQIAMASSRDKALPEGLSVGIAPMPPEDSIATPVEYGIPIPGEVLAGREDRYDGIIVDPQELPAGVEEFQRRLELSLQHWRSQGKRGIWLKLPIAVAQLVPPAVQAGFTFHHAEPGHLMLTIWLPPGPCTLPPNASHQVGIGAFVLNHRREVLAVQEKNGPLRGSGVWKMPTGLVNEAEDICQGAVREVKEETGVDAEFVDIVTFRQAHQIAFGKSDLFFVCALRPVSLEITIQESEIEDAKWMPLEEFRAQPFFASREVFRQMLDLCVLHAEGRYRGFGAKKLTTGISGQPIPYLYWNRTDAEARM